LLFHFSFNRGPSRALGLLRTRDLSFHQIILWDHCSNMRKIYNLIFIILNTCHWSLWIQGWVTSLEFLFILFILHFQFFDLNFEFLN
jgi:hypothetical protein